MENSARIEAQNKTNKIDISVMRNKVSSKGKKWEYVNLAELEFQIRQDERRKEYERRCEERARRKRIAEIKRINRIRSIPFRISGIFLVVTTILLFNSGMLYDESIGLTDGTLAILFIPIGIMLAAAPSKIYGYGSNKNDKKDEKVS